MSNENLEKREGKGNERNRAIQEAKKNLLSCLAIGNIDLAVEQMETLKLLLGNSVITELAEEFESLSLIDDQGVISNEGLDEFGRLEGRLQIAQAYSKAPPPLEISTASEGDASLPDAVLRTGTKDDRFGAAVVEGEVCLLSGAGDFGKSSLMCSIALDFAARKQFVAGAFTPNFGPDDRANGVVIATCEDRPGAVKWRLRKLKAALELDENALDNVHIVNTRKRPLFGPSARNRHLTNTRPEPLPDWHAFWEHINNTEPKTRLVIIDPALVAFVGNQNEPSGVGEFLQALADEAEKAKCAVLLIAHSNKANRSTDKTDLRDPGTVTGSVAWTDRVRGAMTAQWTQDGKRVLVIHKGNYAAKKAIELVPIQDPKTNQYVGMESTGTWQEISDFEQDTEKCKGKFQNGKPCDYKATKNGYCSTHQNQAQETAHGELKSNIF